jgi:PAS domain S-box-containing protein
MNRLLDENFVEQLKTAFEAAYNGIVLVDKDIKIVMINSAAEKILNVSKEKVIGRSFFELVPDNGFSEVIEQKKPQAACCLKIRDKLYLSNRIPVVVNGEIIGAVAVLQDITDLNKLQSQLKNITNLKDILETILDLAYEGIVVVDENGYIKMFNEAYARFLNVKQEDVIGKHVTDVIENTRMHIVLKTGVPELRHIQHIKGHDMICDRIPIKKDGKIIGAVGKVIFRDVSEVDELLKQTEQLKRELEYYKGELDKERRAKYSLENFVGESLVMKNLKEMVRKVAKSPSTVLIRGESGTGKELLAHSIHNLSPRRSRPFVKINCAALPENLLESELFGYEEGAFTGAKKGGKIGKFEQANGGTIFLDEIGDMPLNMQVKILRVLQEKEVERLGGTKSIKVNVRVIAATNRNLEELIKQGKFREDLFYRLNVVNIEIPPLRQRKEDIPLLVDFLLKKLCKTMGSGKKTIGQAALNILLKYSWPGNVRELENILERALNVVEGDEIEPAHLPYYIRQPKNSLLECEFHLKTIVEDTEKEVIKRALNTTGGNALEAAHLLGISKSTFYEKVAKYGIR